MSEKKQKSKKKVLLIVLLMILISTLAGVAYARYMLTLQSNASASIANWEFTLNDSTVDVEKSTDIEVASYTNVTPGKMAPGTKGTFNINIDATNVETAFDYQITFGNPSITLPTNMYFYIGTNETNKYYSLENLAAGLQGTNVTENTIDYTITWVWPYGESINDTAFAGKELSFDIILTATQAEPSEATA